MEPKLGRQGRYLVEEEEEEEEEEEDQSVPTVSISQEEV